MCAETTNCIFHRNATLGDMQPLRVHERLSMSIYWHIYLSSACVIYRMSPKHAPGVVQIYIMSHLYSHLIYLPVLFCVASLATRQSPGSQFNIKMSSYQYRKSHCGDKTIERSPVWQMARATVCNPERYGMTRTLSDHNQTLQTAKHACTIWGMYYLSKCYFCRKTNHAQSNCTRSLYVKTYGQNKYSSIIAWCWFGK